MITQLLKVYYLPIQTKKSLFKCGYIPLIINENFILLLNKDNYLFFDASNIENIHPSTITNFINYDDNNKNIVCNICYNESRKSTLCSRCAYNICIECHAKLKNDLCPVCKFNIGSCIKIF